MHGCFQTFCRSHFLAQCANSIAPVRISLCTVQKLNYFFFFFGWGGEVAFLNWQFCLGSSLFVLFCPTPAGCCFFLTRKASIQVINIYSRCRRRLDTRYITLGSEEISFLISLFKNFILFFICCSRLHWPKDGYGSSKTATQHILLSGLYTAGVTNEHKIGSGNQLHEMSPVCLCHKQISYPLIFPRLWRGYNQCVTRKICISTWRYLMGNMENEFTRNVKLSVVKHNWYWMVAE